MSASETTIELPFTIFRPSHTKGKIPLSNNDEFDFRNVLVDFKDVHNLFKNNFVLSRPLIKETTAKRNSSLSDIYSTSCGYCVLDFDDIYYEEDALSIVEYFKNNNFSANLFKSRSYGLFDETIQAYKYNLKGILLIETESTKTMSQAHLNFISNMLEGLCTMDFSSTSVASYQAPSFNSEQMYFNIGECVPEELLRDYIPKAPQKMDYEFNEETTKWFWGNMITKYNATPKGTINSNGTMNISLPSEKKTSFSYFWNPNFPWKIQHPNVSKSIDMFSDFIQSELGKSFIKEKNMERFRNYFSSIGANLTLSQCSRYMEVSKDVSDVLAMEANTVLLVKGIMGGGKSNVVEEYSKSNRKILYITMRKTLSYDMLEKYEAKHYIEHLGEAKNRYRQGDSLIVQIDSLHKINTDFFDTVVIDEFESLCLYTQSNMVKSSNYVKNMKLLYKLFESNKKFIIMDTFLNDFSINMYFPNKRKILLENSYKDASMVYVYTVKETFINVLEHKAKTKDVDEVITCSFGTLNDLYATKELLERHALKVVVMDAETSEESKKLMSKLFKEDKVVYDVVLYSPTITVGISILNNVKHHFHYDSGKSVDPISSIQMLKRSRKATSIHACIEGDKIVQKTFDLEILNERTKTKLSKLDFDTTDIVFYNSDTNDISELGKFVNKFIAHKNFYENNHRQTCMFMLGVQFSDIRLIEDSTNNLRYKKILREVKKTKSNKGMFDDFKLNYSLDMSQYDDLKRKSSLSSEEKQHLALLEVKMTFSVLSDAEVLEVASLLSDDREYLMKIKNLFFYTLSDSEKKTVFMDNLLVNQSSLMTDKDLGIYDFLSKVKLQDIYTRKEVQTYKNLDMFFRVGYKKKNGCLILDSQLKNVVNLLIRKGWKLR